jgi:hypothetical protein
MNPHHLARARAILAEAPTRRDRRRILPPDPIVDPDKDDRPFVPDGLRAHNFVQVATARRWPDAGKPLTFVESRVASDRRWSDRTWDALAK